MENKTVYFALALHFHQPVGNFDNIFERAYNFCYKPFFELLSEYPDVKMTFHVSGCLLDYLEDKHPDIIELLRKMAMRRQIEMMGGGYYEPILTAIPERDVVGQIRMMSEYIEKRFGSVPKGMWIPERVWEPRLAGPIYDAGIHYSILDDTHFLRSGVKKEDMHGYFLTGEEEKKIAIFPSDKSLRYTIPFELPEKTIDYFRSASYGRENFLFTYGDDGEKFGEWPGTHKWVFEEKWLKNFFELLIQNKAWVKMVTFSEYLEKNKSIGEIEINPCSYEEMMEWSNGSWMNFLKKYPESNQMHKKMLYVSAKIAGIEKDTRVKDLEETKEAKRELYKAQCNCAYWHGVFGGLYLYHLRKAVYEHLIIADKISDGILHKGEKKWIDIKMLNFDMDGKKDALMKDEVFSINVDPDEGGAIKELDYRPLSLNLINTLSRKEEAYHKKILEAVTKTSDSIQTIHSDNKAVAVGLKEKIVYDRFPRYCLRDYFLRDGITPEDFFNSIYEESGSFSTGQYKVKKEKKSVILKRESRVFGKLVSLSKELSIKSAKELDFSYSIEKKDSGGGLNAIFAIEFNITMPYLDSDRYSYSSDGKNIAGLNSRGIASDMSSFGIADSGKEFGVNFKFSTIPTEVWYFPVETVSQSERSYELNYQCSCIVPVWRLDFSKNKNWHFGIRWGIL